jgi:hypothetical protein
MGNGSKLQKRRNRVRANMKQNVVRPRITPCLIQSIALLKHSERLSVSTRNRLRNLVFILTMARLQADQYPLLFPSLAVGVSPVCRLAVVETVSLHVEESELRISSRLAEAAQMSFVMVD